MTTYEQTHSRDAGLGVSLEGARWGLAVSATLAVVVPFLLYLRTMAPTIYNIDSAELATAASTGGIPHPPGYPLYVLLARGFAVLPLGDVGYRVNLMSAVFAAVALACVFAIIMRLTQRPLAALAGTWTLGLSFPFWSQSIVAEVYTLDIALVAGMLLFLLRWDDSRDVRYLVVAFALFGLSLTNRTSNLMMLPAIAYFVLPAWRADPRRVLGASLAALPPLALYALLPLRSLQGAGYRWGSWYDADARAYPLDLSDPGEFWWYVSAAAFRSLITLHSFTDRIREAGVFAADFWSALLGGGVIVGGLGIAWLALRRRRVAMMLLLVAAPQAIFFVNYAAPDKDTMFLTVYAVTAVCVGCGAARALSLLDGTTLSYKPVLAAGVAATWALLLVLSNFSLLDLSDDYRARDRSEALFDIAPQNAVIIGRWTDVAPLEYLQLVEHHREDVALVHEWRMSRQDLRQMARHNLDEGRAVFVFRKDATFKRYFGFKPVGDGWYELTRETVGSKEVP